MLEAFTISSESRFHTLIILTKNNWCEHLFLNFGTISLYELPRVLMTLLIVKNLLGVNQQNDAVFYNT